MQRVCEVGTLPESIRHSLNVLLWIEQLVWYTQTVFSNPSPPQALFFPLSVPQSKGLVERELALCLKSSPPLLPHWGLNISQAEILSRLLFSYTLTGPWGRIVFGQVKGSERIL